MGKKRFRIAKLKSLGGVPKKNLNLNSTNDSHILKAHLKAHLKESRACFDDGASMDLAEP